MRTRAAATLAKGGATILHDHLRAIAQATYDDDKTYQNERRTKLSLDRDASSRQAAQSPMDACPKREKEHAEVAALAIASPTRTTASNCAKTLAPSTARPFAKRPLSFSQIV